MKSYKRLETNATFFPIEPLSKTGYRVVVCHRLFQCKIEKVPRDIRRA